jgi:hypothetical protein
MRAKSSGVRENFLSTLLMSLVPTALQSSEISANLEEAEEAHQMARGRDVLKESLGGVVSGYPCWG